MSKRNSWSTLLLFAAAAVLAAGCSSKKPTTAPEEKPAAQAQEQPVAPPTTAPEEKPKPAGGVLSEDLQTINSRGYLKDAFFDYDRAELRDDARAALSADAQWMRQFPSIQALIEGHCDERGTEEYNLSLGDRRASASKEYLVSLGVDAGRVRTVSYGKDRPFCSDHAEPCWQQNRRGHFVVTAK